MYGHTNVTIYYCEKEGDNEPLLYSKRNGWITRKKECTGKDEWIHEYIEMDKWVDNGCIVEGFMNRPI